MKKMQFTLWILFFVIDSFGQTIWKSDHDHSRLDFVVTNLGITDVRGAFADFDITITTSKPDFRDAVVMIEARTNSINTMIAKRDDHLKGVDFFDAATYKYLRFVSESIDSTSVPNVYRMRGNLTMHGIKKSVVFDFYFRGTVKDITSNNREVSGVQIKGMINRSDFHIGDKYPFFIISDRVLIKVDAQFVKVGSKN